MARGVVLAHPSPLMLLEDHVIHHSLAIVASSGPIRGFVDGRQAARLTPATVPRITRVG